MGTGTISCSLRCKDASGLVLSHVPLVEEHIVGMHVEFAGRSVRELSSELVEAFVDFVGPKDAA